MTSCLSLLFSPDPNTLPERFYTFLFTIWTMPSGYVLSLIRKLCMASVGISWQFAGVGLQFQIDWFWDLLQRLVEHTLRYISESHKSVALVSMSSLLPQLLWPCLPALIPGCGEVSGSALPHSATIMSLSQSHWMVDWNCNQIKPHFKFVISFRNKE